MPLTPCGRDSAMHRGQFHIASLIIVGRLELPLFGGASLVSLPKVVLSDLLIDP